MSKLHQGQGQLVALPTGFQERKIVRVGDRRLAKRTRHLDLARKGGITGIGDEWVNNVNENNDGWFDEFSNIIKDFINNNKDRRDEYINLQLQACVKWINNKSQSPLREREIAMEIAIWKLIVKLRTGMCNRCLI